MLSGPAVSTNRWNSRGNGVPPAVLRCQQEAGGDGIGALCAPIPFPIPSPPSLSYPRRARFPHPSICCFASLRIIIVKLPGASSEGIEKNSPSIIRRTCTIESKKGLDFGCSMLVTRYKKRRYKYFRKIEICAKIVALFVENCVYFAYFNGKMALPKNA